MWFFVKRLRWFIWSVLTKSTVMSESAWALSFRFLFFWWKLRLYIHIVSHPLAVHSVFRLIELFWGKGSLCHGTTLVRDRWMDVLYIKKEEGSSIDKCGSLLIPFITLTTLTLLSRSISRSYPNNFHHLVSDFSTLVKSFISLCYSVRSECAFHTEKSLWNVNRETASVRKINCANVYPAFYEKGKMKRQNERLNKLKQTKCIGGDEFDVDTVQ